MPLLRRPSWLPAWIVLSVLAPTVAGATAVDAEPDPRLSAIARELAQSQWATARRLAKDLMESLVDRGGGTPGDHRRFADQLGGAMASTDPPVAALLLGRAAGLRAVAEAALDRSEDARWYWYIAQNLDRDARTMDHTRFGKAGRILSAHRLANPDVQHAELHDVIDPVRPERASGPRFVEPQRTRVAYPYLPRDLLGRDRFSHVVFVQVTIDTSGRLTQPLVVDGGFYPGMIVRAFEALREWRYRPATLDGRPIPFRFVVPVAFVNDRAILPLAEWSADLPSTTTLVTGITLDRPTAATIDRRSGTLYVADADSGRILRVEANGRGAAWLAPIAGTNADASRDPGPTALFTGASGVAYDGRTGQLFVADTRDYRVHAVSRDGTHVRTVAGVGLRGVDPRRIPHEIQSPGALDIGRFSGDAGPAIEAELNLPSGVCADPFGILFIADSGNHRIRAVNLGTSPLTVMGVDISPGHIRTVAGVGTAGFSGDGQRATAAQFAFPTRLAVDAAGNLLVVDTFNQRIRRIDRQSGVVRTLARGSAADVPAARAIESWSRSIVGLAVTDAQDVIFADRSDHTVRAVSRSGDERVLYRAPAREGDYIDLDIGPNGEIYLVESRRIGVLHLAPSRTLTYRGGIMKPLPNRAGVKSSAANRTP